MIAATILEKIKLYTIANMLDEVTAIENTTYALAREFKSDNDRFDFSKFVSLATGKAL